MASLGSNLIKTVTSNALGGRVAASLMARNRKAFTSVFRILENDRNGHTPATQFDQTTESGIQQVADAMSQKGIGVWQGLFSDPKWLASIRNLFETELPVFDARLKEASENNLILKNEESGLEYRYSRLELAHRAKGNDDTLFGRKRLFVKPGTPIANESPFKELMANEVLQEAAQRYLGCSVKINGILAEELSPALEGDFWHIDLLRDQFKVMILLSDVTEENGPIVYKTGTHRTRNQPINLLHHQVFRYGKHYAYPSPTLVDAMDGEVVLGTGKAGDALFFDTLGIHSGSRCVSGSRQALVIYFDVYSIKNQVLTNLGA